MSGLVKGIKKVFKKAVKFVKKHWKVIVIAVAVYFTAGVALAAMPSTAAFSAAMPGFGTGGFFSNIAVSMGATGAAGSGIAGTVAANAAAAAGSAAAVGAGSAAAGGSGLGMSAGGAAGASVGGSALSAASQAATLAAAPAAAAGTTAAVAGTTAAVAGMTALEKVALASTVFQGAGALLSDSEDEVNRKQHDRQNEQAFGIGRDGTGPGYGGVVQNTWKNAGFGNTGSPFGGAAPGGAAPGEADQSAAPAPPGAYSDSGESPFGVGEELTSQSEAASAFDQQKISSGYRNKNYMPV